MRERAGLARPLSPSAAALSGPAADRLLLAALALGVAGRLAFVLAAPMSDVVARSTDDAYYYFNVARNVVQGQGWTFDQINRTNGFHPLWMTVLLPVFALAGPENDAALRAAFALVTLVGGAAVWFAFLAVSRAWGRAAGALAAVLLAAPPFVNTLLCGLETGLLLLLLFVLLWADGRYDLTALQAPASRNLSLGLVLAAVFLCRLDSVFLAAAVMTVWWVPRWGEDGRRRLPPLGPAVRKTLQAGSVVLLLGIAYLGWNLVQFGHLVPISGAVKSSFPDPTFRLARLVNPHVAFGWVQLVVSGLVLARLRVRRGEGEARLRLLTAMAGGNLAHFAYSILFMNWGVHWWHFASYLPVTLTCVAAGLTRGRGENVRLRPAAAALALAVLVLSWAADNRLRGNQHAVWYESAQWARASLPADAVVGMTDCGVFGYFSARRTINLDGVINGYEYQEALRRGRVAAYLRERGVTHIADYDVEYPRGSYLIRLHANFSRLPGAALVAREDGEVYRSAPYRDPFNEHGAIHFALWPLSTVRVIEDRRSLGP